MPAKSQAQRGFLAHKFGISWMRRHHFANKGHLPAHKNKHKMSDTSRLVRLAQIDNQLESIVQFDDDNDKKSLLGTAGYATAGAGAAGLGLYGAGKMASVAKGGQGLSAMGATRDLGYNLGHLAEGGAASIGRNIKQGAGVAAGAAKSIGGKIWDAAKGIFKPAAGALSSKDKPIEFGALSTIGKKLSKSLITPASVISGGALGYGGYQFGRILGKKKKPTQAYGSTENPIEFGTEILGPWQGSTGHTSKIDQLEFPAALGPLQLMKFSLPALMRYMNQRNLQQQVFSWKHERLINLSSKLKEITFEDREYKPRIGQRLILGPGITTGVHAQRGKHIGGLLQAGGRSWWESTKGGVGGLGLGAGVGAGIGALTGLKHPGQVGERAIAGAVLGGQVGGGVGGLLGNVRGKFGKRAEEIYRQRTGQVGLSAMIDDILEFKEKDYKEEIKKRTKDSLTKLKTGKDKIMNKIAARKGHKSHGGGT